MGPTPFLEPVLESGLEGPGDRCAVMKFGCGNCPSRSLDVWESRLTGSCISGDAFAILRALLGAALKLPHFGHMYSRKWGSRLSKYYSKRMGKKRCERVSSHTLSRTSPL